MPCFPKCWGQPQCLNKTGPSAQGLSHAEHKMAAEFASTVIVLTQSKCFVIFLGLYWARSPASVVGAAALTLKATLFCSVVADTNQEDQIDFYDAKPKEIHHLLARLSSPKALSCRGV